MRFGMTRFGRWLALIERYRSRPLRRKIALAATHFVGRGPRLRPALLAAVLLALVLGFSRDSAAAESPADYPPLVAGLWDRNLCDDRTDATLAWETDSFTPDQIGALELLNCSSRRGVTTWAAAGPPFPSQPSRS